MVTRALLVSVLLLAPTLAAAQSNGPERLRIEGSDALGDHLIPDMMTVWLKQISYAKIKRRDIDPSRVEISATSDQGVPLIVDIQKSDTATGLADLIKGTADMSMSTRQINAKEKKAAWNLGDLTSPDQEWVVALDGLAVVTAPGNPVANVSQNELRDVFSGKINNWSGLGGSPGPIVPCFRPSGGGKSSEALSTLVLNGAKLAPAATTYPSDAAIVSAVAKDPKLVCVVQLKTPLTGAKALAIRIGSESFSPDEMSVKSEDYPLVRRLYLHTSQSPGAVGLGFAQFAISAAGQTLVDRSELVSLALRVGSAPPSASGSADYVKFLGNAHRISTTLHFSSGADMFDSRARQDMDRLAAFTRSAGAARKLVLAAFVNPDPKLAFQSVVVSNQRADTVGSEMMTLGIHVLKARGFGSTRLVANPEEGTGAYRNDRIEVWLAQDDRPAVAKGNAKGNK